MGEIGGGLVRVVNKFSWERVVVKVIVEVIDLGGGESEDVFMQSV